MVHLRKSRWLCGLCLSVFALVSAAGAEAQLALPKLLSDNAVFQRGARIPIWGTAAPQEAITVKLGERAATTAADADGNWRVELDPLDAGGPFDLAVTGKDETLTVKNILVGDVWLCIGHSNMGWQLNRVPNMKDELAAAKHPLIRLAIIEHAETAKEPRADMPLHWAVCEPAAAAKFSAVGYFFGCCLHEELKVPIGLITGIDGSRFPLLPSREAFQGDKFMEGYLKRPGTSDLFNTYIAPLTRMPIKGVLTCSTGKWRRSDYALFRVGVLDWRKQWKQDDLSFVCIQLPEYINQKSGVDPHVGQDLGGRGWAFWRDDEFRALAKLPHTALVVTLGMGVPDNLHPPDKKPVGERAALTALGTVYGRKIKYSGPIYQAAKVEGDEVRISFTHLGGGLVAKDGGPLKGFEIAGEDQKFVWAKAEIDGDTVVVQSDKVTQPAAVRYAFWSNPVFSLYNKAGLPASPFRTDDWPEPPAKR